MSEPYDLNSDSDSEDASQPVQPERVAPDDDGSTTEGEEENEVPQPEEMAAAVDEDEVIQPEEMAAAVGEDEVTQPGVTAAAVDEDEDTEGEEEVRPQREEQECVDDDEDTEGEEEVTQQEEVATRVDEGEDTDEDFDVAPPAARSASHTELWEAYFMQCFSQLSDEVCSTGSLPCVCPTPYRPAAHSGRHPCFVSRGLACGQFNTAMTTAGDGEDGLPEDWLSSDLRVLFRARLQQLPANGASAADLGELPKVPRDVLHAMQPDTFVSGGFVTKYLQVSPEEGSQLLRAFCGYGYSEDTSLLRRYQVAHKAVLSRAGAGRGHAAGKGRGRGGRASAKRPRQSAAGAGTSRDGASTSTQRSNATWRRPAPAAPPQSLGGDDSDTDEDGYAVD